MGQLIDSSVVIALERRGASVDEVLALAGGNPILLASITASELLVGVERTGGSGHRRRAAAFVRAVLADVPVLPFDLDVARVHARLWVQTRRAGQPIGDHDLIIAATALANGHDLLTLNLRHFARVPGLVVLTPSC